jgi:glycosyltransferase involved in cell wall biosynthesis
MELSFLVLGVAKNCQKTLRRTVAAVSKLLPPNSLVSIFVVESDSKDGTVELMKALRRENPSFDFLSLGSLELTEPDRIRRIAYCRNAYLDQLDQARLEGKQYDYVVVADFDGVNSKLQTLEPMDAVLSDSKVVCANQIGRYYDILALRKSGWVDEDYRVTNSRSVAQGSNPILCHLRNVSGKQIKISRFAKNIEVESAFGGLSIYPVKAIAGLRYSAELLRTGVYECEHVSLNKQVRQRGYAIEIVPGLQNSGSRRHTFLTFLPISGLAFAAKRHR